MTPEYFGGIGFFNTSPVNILLGEASAEKKKPIEG
jgi:hypothetical protein